MQDLIEATLALEPLALVRLRSPPQRTNQLVLTPHRLGELALLMLHDTLLLHPRRRFHGLLE